MESQDHERSTALGTCTECGNCIHLPLQQISACCYDDIGKCFIQELRERSWLASYANKGHLEKVFEKWIELHEKFWKSIDATHVFRKERAVCYSDYLHALLSVRIHGLVGTYFNVIVLGVFSGQAAPLFMNWIHSRMKDRFAMVSGLPHVQQRVFSVPLMSSDSLSSDTFDPIEFINNWVFIYSGVGHYLASWGNFIAYTGTYSPLYNPTSTTVKPTELKKNIVDRLSKLVALSAPKKRLREQEQILAQLSETRAMIDVKFSKQVEGGGNIASNSAEFQPAQSTFSSNWFIPKEIDEWLSKMTPDAVKAACSILVAYFKIILSSDDVSGLMYFLRQTLLLGEDKRFPSLCLVGRAGTGKTTIFHAIKCMVFGGGTIQDARGCIGDSFTSHTDDSVFIAFDEFEGVDRTFAGKVKNMMSNDTTVVHRKYQNKVTVKKNYHIAIGTNSEVVASTKGGRRMLIYNVDGNSFTRMKSNLYNLLNWSDQTTYSDSLKRIIANEIPAHEFTDCVNEKSVMEKFTLEYSAARAKFYSETGRYASAHDLFLGLYACFFKNAIPRKPEWLIAAEKIDQSASSDFSEFTVYGRNRKKFESLTESSRAFITIAVNQVWGERQVAKESYGPLHSFFGETIFWKQKLEDMKKRYNAAKEKYPFLFNENGAMYTIPWTFSPNVVGSGFNVSPTGLSDINTIMSTNLQTLILTLKKSDLDWKTLLKNLNDGEETHFQPGRSIPSKEAVKAYKEMILDLNVMMFNSVCTVSSSHTYTENNTYNVSSYSVGMVTAMLHSKFGDIINSSLCKCETFWEGGDNTYKRQKRDNYITPLLNCMMGNGVESFDYGKLVSDYNHPHHTQEYVITKKYGPEETADAIKIPPAYEILKFYKYTD